MADEIDKERDRLQAAVREAESNLATFTAAEPIVEEPSEFAERLIGEAKTQLDQAMEALADFNRRHP